MLLECMQLQSMRLRRTASSSIAALVATQGLSDWPELITMLQSKIIVGDETAFDTLHEILEESKMLEDKGCKPETLW